MLKNSAHPSYEKFREKEWYILIQGKQQGPYSLKDLHSHSHFTPDTLVWKKGFAHWKMARHVPELKEVFKDQKKNVPPEEEALNSEAGSGYGQKQMTLALHHDPYQFWLWVLIFLIILFYVIYAQID